LEKGRFPNVPSKPSPDNSTDNATVASHFSLAPGETKQVVFVLAWHFPNTENYWTTEDKYKGQFESCRADAAPASMKMGGGTRYAFQCPEAA